jgi:putative Mg2+ transporter-C (MgtC) family protein
MDHGPLGEIGDTVFRLGLATVIGGALGLNRELHHKSAGLRTHALVALGSAVATFVSIEMCNPVGTNDMGPVTRVVQGVLTGIGFLGAGVIFREDGGKTIKGLTTAASIWVVACLGMACGAGRAIPALVGFAITLAVLVYGGALENFLHTHVFHTGEIDDTPAPPKTDGP